MNNLLYKEINLSASPLSFIFIAFALLTFVPGYPILVSSFFICFGIFQSFQSSRENNDILYTVLLPVKKSDTVKAKYIFTCFIQLTGFIIMLIGTVIRMTLMPDAVPFVTNAMMNANLAFLGYSLLVFALFNCVFIRGFFRTGYKFGKPFIIFIILAFILICICEALHHIPGLEFLNATSLSASLDKAYMHWIILCVAALVYIIATFLSERRAEKLFEKVDL